MKTEWFKHLKTKEEQEKFKEVVNSSTLILDRLREIVYNRYKNGNSISIDDYDSPSWAYKQADRLGEQRAYEFILSLLNIEQQS